MRQAFGAVFVTVFVLLSAGCESGSSSQTPVTTAPAKPKPVKSAQDSLAAMAHAVVVAKPDTQVELSYDIQGRPAPGGATDVKLLFMPTADAESLAADITVSPPLTVTGELKAGFSNVRVGQTNEHHFTVTAPADMDAGIYLANVAVSLTRGGMISTKSFAIPLVVGSIGAAAPAKPAG